MAGDEGGEKSIPQSVPFRPLKFWEKLNLPWMRKKPSPEAVQKIDSRKPFNQPIIQQNPTEPTATLSPQEPPKQEILQRQTDIGEAFTNRLKEQGIIIETPEFESVGVAALGGTNEKGDPFLFEKVRKHPQAPNGYLIGIGVANVFSMLETFPEGSIPKAVFLFDVDPKVVAAGQELIESLKHSPDNLPLDIDHFLKQNPQIFYPHAQMSHKSALVKYAKVLHQLANEGNLVIARADFTNSTLIEELSRLPDIQKSSNVVYLSNIADHLWRRNYREDPNYVPNFGYLRPLHPLFPARNFYVDTLTSNLAYNLRVSTRPPKFGLEDFNSPWFASSGWQTKPTDEIDGIAQNLVWEDISGWEKNQLVEKYEELSKKPIQEDRKQTVQESMNRVRTSQKKRYPELKQNSDKAGIRGRETRVLLPQTSEEEQALLDDLARPYDYERDFIPFIATNLWQGAKTPLDVNYYSIPKRKLFERNPKTDTLIDIVDPTQWMKGKCELWFLEGGIPYEELVLAKLYREMANQAQVKGLVTQGKTFEELSQELLAAA